MRKLAIAIVAFGILVCIPVLLGLWTGYLDPWLESRYRSAFLAVPDVEEVANFLYYEGHTGASLKLKGGRYLDIAEFDENVGTSTNEIGLIQIGRLTVVCWSTPEKDSGVAGGFNILDVMSSSPLQLRLRNIGDVVAHYDEIYRYLEESLPPPQRGEPKEFDVGDRSLWCSRGTPRN